MRDRDDDPVARQLQLDELDPTVWNRAVERSSDASVYHRYEFLDVLRAHSTGRLRILGYYSDGELAGAFPLFVFTKGPLDAVLSPPPQLGVPFTGPILLDETTIEETNDMAIRRRFLDECRRWLAEELDPVYVRIETTPGFTDPGVFHTRSRFSIGPQFTYVVDLDRPVEELFESFSRDARSNVRSVGEHGYEFRLGGRDAIERTLRDVHGRYAEQGLSFTISKQFVTELYERLPDGVVRPYVLAIDDEYACGMVALDWNGTVSRWIGGAKPTVDLPVNDVLDWAAMCDAAERGRTRYDLVGANERRIAAYKSKFNPSLVPMQVLEYDTLTTNLLTRTYHRIRNAGITPTLL